MDKTTRLKVALQKSGRLTDNSLDLLVRCGLKYSRGKDQLMCYGENMPLDVLLVRDDDIPDLVQQDVCDLGIVGLNVIEEKRLAFKNKGIAPLFEQLMVCQRILKDMYRNRSGYHLHSFCLQDGCDRAERVLRVILDLAMRGALGEAENQLRA